MVCITYILQPCACTAVSFNKVFIVHEKHEWSTHESVKGKDITIVLQVGEWFPVVKRREEREPVIKEGMGLYWGFTSLSTA